MNLLKGIFVGALVAVVIDIGSHVLLLEPTGIVPQPEGPPYYLTKLGAASVGIYFAVRLQISGRAFIGGLIGASLFGLYYALTRPWIPYFDASIIFLIHIVAITVGAKVGVALSGQRESG